MQDCKLFVDAVIVVYKADCADLSRTISSLSGQVRSVYLINNGSESLVVENWRNVYQDSLGRNYGIAYAENVGIHKALSAGADFVLISDQDTVFPDDYVRMLLDKYLAYTKMGCLVGAIAPVYRNLNFRGKLYPVVNFRRGVLVREYLHHGDMFVSHVIASGMLIPATSFQALGMMNEKLFIDWVDTEWCWRATNSGYKILQTADTCIFHRLGSETMEGRFVKKPFTVRGRIRDYYIIRNAVYLGFRGYWLIGYERAFLIFSSVKYFIKSVLFSSKKIDSIISNITAIIDGMRMH